MMHRFSFGYWSFNRNLFTTSWVVDVSPVQRLSNLLIHGIIWKLCIEFDGTFRVGSQILIQATSSIYPYDQH